MEDMKNGTVIITKKQYEDLLRAERKLVALECAGVDNWDGYCYAMQEFYEEEDE